MSFPIPSFPKIRFVVLILGFFVLFFFTGFVRWCFANDGPIVGDIIAANGTNYHVDSFTYVAGATASWDEEVTFPNGLVYFDGAYLHVYVNVGPYEHPVPGAYVYDWYRCNVTITTDVPTWPPPDCDTLTQEFIDSCPSGSGYYDCLEPANSYCDPENCGPSTQDCIDQCNGQVNIAEFECTEDSQGYQVTTPCTCKDYDCNDLLAQCYSQCSNQIDNFSCDDTSGTPVVSVPCDCMESTPDIADGQSGDEPPPGQSEDTTTPEAPTTDPNSKIAAANTKLIADINGQYLPEIDKSIKANGAKIDQTNDTLDDISDTLSSIDKNIESLDQNLDGSYNKETITNDYSIDEGLNQTSQFTDRFSTFITDLKATPLFSLPNQVLFNIPNSTESSYTIEMGQYGQAEIDFSNYAGPLLILRAALLLCFSYAGLRIVVSKK